MLWAFLPIAIVVTITPGPATALVVRSALRGGVRAAAATATIAANSLCVRHTPVYNELGWAALAVPTEDGPVQVAGRAGSEPSLLTVGHRIGLTAAETVVS